jgi:hypothetical protein
MVPKGKDMVLNEIFENLEVQNHVVFSRHLSGNSDLKFVTMAMNLAASSLVITYSVGRLKTE